jgi:hypothetical protein
MVLRNTDSGTIHHFLIHSWKTIQSVDPQVRAAVKSMSPFERLREAPVDTPQELARFILIQAEQFRRHARLTDDAVVHDELMALASRCDAAAAAMLSYAGGNSGNLISHLLQ